MSYQTPELLLVGTAQNLVLGTEPIKGDLFNRDYPGSWTYEVQPVESLGW